MLEQPAELLLAANVGERNRLGDRLLTASTFCAEQFIVLALVRPQAVVVIDEHAAQVVQVPLAKDNEVVKAFLPKVWMNRSTKATVFGEQKASF